MTTRKKHNNQSLVKKYAISKITIPPPINPSHTLSVIAVIIKEITSHKIKDIQPPFPELFIVISFS